MDLPDLLNLKVQQMATAIAEGREQLIRSTIDAALGRKDWTNEEIIPRIGMEIRAGMEFFQLDGRDLIVFAPMESRFTDDYKLHAGFKYKVVWGLHD